VASIQIYFEGGEIFSLREGDEASVQRAGSWGSWGGGSHPPHQPGDLGEEHCKLPQRGPKI